MYPKVNSRGVAAFCDHSLSVITLSSCEAEPYATNKAAANCLGMRSIMQDPGVKLEIRRLTDSSTSRAIILRRGLGKVRHTSTNALWPKEKVHDGDVAPIKLKNVFTTSDLLTRSQDKQTINHLMDLMDHVYVTKRSVAAPQLKLSMTIAVRPRSSFTTWASTVTKSEDMLGTLGLG